MPSKKSVTLTYLFSSLTLFGFYFLASGQSRMEVLVLAIAFASISLFLAISHRLRHRLVRKTAEFISGVPIGHLSIFLPIAAFGITLILNELVTPGMFVILGAYVYLAVSIGRQVGHALKCIILKLEHILMD